MTPPGTAWQQGFPANSSVNSSLKFPSNPGPVVRQITYDRSVALLKNKPVGSARQRSRFTAIILSLGLLWLPLSETLHHYAATSWFSLNLSLTAIYFLGVVAIAILDRRALPLFFITSLMVIGVASNITNGYSIASAQYLLTLAAMALTLFALLTSEDLSTISRVAFVSAYLAAAFLALELIVDFSWHGRAGQSVAPLAVVCLFAFGQYLGRWYSVAGCLGAYTTLIAVSANTSRMATATTFLVIAIWLLFFSPWTLPLRVGLVTATTAAEAAYWRFNSWANERLVGRDASLEIGPLRINGEGRSEAARILSDASQDGEGIIAHLLGHGVGYTQNALGVADFHLDKPHNEVIRLSSDVGLLGIGLWSIFILAILALGVRAAYRSRRSPAALIFIGVSVTLAGFTYSDNPLSYAWLLIPSGVLLAWAFNSVRLDRSALNSSGASLPEAKQSDGHLLA